MRLQVVDAISTEIPRLSLEVEVFSAELATMTADAPAARMAAAVRAWTDA